MSFACSGWALISPSPEKDSSVTSYKQSLSKDIKWIRISTRKKNFLFFPIVLQIKLIAGLHAWLLALIQ